MIKIMVHKVMLIVIDLDCDYNNNETKPGEMWLLSMMIVNIMQIMSPVPPMCV